MMEQVEQQLGNYRLIQLLGKGAFADVYLGEHLYLNTPVAIKVLRSRVDTSTLADFLSEVRHISHLVHPHIIRVFEVGLEAESPFLVMDYAPYGSLRRLYPPGAVVPLSTIVSSVMALASALQCAHDEHQLHRDLKPENVLLGPKHEVLLSDFGLALLTSDREQVQVKERFGTLSYMAPELILDQPVPASDQYALAVMVYEWICGQLPFRGLTAHLTNQHLNALPPPLCERHPAIPRAVEQVVFKGLSKEPTQRYVDVLSFAVALEEASSAVSPSYSLPALRTARSSQHDLHRRFRNVPVPLTPLIGRERELQAVRDLLMRPGVRLVTLTGTGGIGKTHLALILGSEVLEAFAEGVCFVSLSTIYDSELVIPAIAQALGLLNMGDRSPFEHLKTFLRNRQLLLVLDTFEQVLPAAPLLTDLLSSCPGLKLLVTSRALLQVGGEFAFTLPTLEVPNLQHLPALETLSKVSSVALFVHWTRAKLPGFHLTEENARDVAGICARLEGVPLALELAAARSTLLSPQALLSRLEHPVEVLTGGRRDAPPRLQTLHNALSWNDNVLTADEQTLFRRLAIFVGGFSLQAAEAITAALGGMSISVLDGVSALINKSMLQQPAYWKDEPRLYLLEVLREYGLECLEAKGEREQTRDVHAAYFLARALEAESVMPGANQVVWQERLALEVKNLRAALEWLLERRQVEEALRMATALEQCWLCGDYLSEGRGFLEQALAASCESDVHVSTRVKARARRVADYLVGNQKDRACTSDHMEECERLIRQLQDRQDTCEELTEREIEVLRLLAMGLRSKQIAERLVLSHHTVSGYTQSIFGKLGLNSRSAATRYALEHHLV